MRLVVTLFAFFLLFLGNDGLSASQDLNCNTQQCVAVIDAGSTGSRLHVYVFDRNQRKDPVNIHEGWVKKIKPGFASIAANQDKVNAYLEQLFAQMPTSNKLPVYFYATGGMRLIPDSEQATRYKLLKRWFAKHKDVWLVEGKTISGQEEGLFDWLAVNYQLGHFDDPSHQTVGVMDMGGASVQVAFTLENSDTVKPEDRLELTVYGQRYTLFSHSFLGLGQNEILKQFINQPECFTTDYPMPNQQPGKGDGYVCKAAVADDLTLTHHVAELVKPAREGSLVKSWYVMGGVVDMVSGKPFNAQNQLFTSQDMLNLGDNSVCKQQWSFLSEAIPNNDYLFGYCFFSAYYFALMVDGYGLEPNQSINFLSAQQTSDWTIGVILAKAN